MVEPVLPVSQYGEFMNGNPVFSLKPKLPLPFLNPRGGSEEGVGILQQIFLRWKRLGAAVKGPPCLLLTRIGVWGRW